MVSDEDHMLSGVYRIVVVFAMRIDLSKLDREKMQQERKHLGCLRRRKKRLDGDYKRGRYG